MLIGTKLSKERMEEIGIEQFVQCVKFAAEDKIENTYVTLTLNVLGILYSVQVPKHEADNEQNIIDAWRQNIQEMGIWHLMGQKKRVIDGHRELTEGEQKAKEESNGI